MDNLNLAFALGAAYGVLATLTIITAVTAVAFVVINLIERKRK